MPKDFEKCVENGGKVRRVSGPSKKHGLEKNEYVDYCTRNGKTYRGEVKKKDSKNNNSIPIASSMLVPNSSTRFTDDAHVEFAKNEDDNEEGIASILAYSGKVMHHWLWGDLAIDVEGIKFPKGKKPVLEQHDPYRKIGFHASQDTSQNKLELKDVKLLSNEEAQEFYNNSKEGFPYQASISVKPTKIEELFEGESAEVNGYNLKGPAMIFRASEYRETSVCVFGVDGNTKSEALSDEEEDFTELDVELINSYADSADFSEPENEQNYDSKEDSNMNLDELKKNHPELVTALTEEIKNQFSEELDNKKKEIENLKNAKGELEKENTDLHSRVSSLEKKDILRTEQELKTAVMERVNASLAESNVPERLREKFKTMFSYNSYVQDDNSINFEQLDKDITAELKEWEEGISQSTGASVKGVGGNFHAPGGGSNQTNLEEDSDEVANRVLSHMGIVSNSDDKSGE